MKQPTRHIALRALDAVMQPDHTATSGKLSPQLAEFRYQHREWLLDDRIIGYGYLSKGGSLGAPGRRPKAAIYVDSDDKADHLKEIVPSSIDVPGSDIATDVEIINIGHVTPSSPTAKNRPLCVGVSISHSRLPSGSMGALVRHSLGREGEYHLLSSNHVLTEYNRFQAGDPILQPGTSDKGRITDKIAELSHFIELNFNDQEFLNTADAALALITDSTCLPEGIGAMVPALINRGIRHNSTVHMTGRTSGRSVGQVVDTAARLRLRYPRGPKSTSYVGFTDVVLCTPFTRRGDSGAAVLDGNDAVVGLVMAGSDRASIFCKIGYVIDQLNINQILVVR
ncbi:MAG: hypothetical protein ABI395_11140 [Sphingobium sp.]